MTCGVCKYEFCWACGASATAEDNHFGEFRGCGVKMMDESVRPGDRGKHLTGEIIFTFVLYAFLYITLYPVVLVLACPVLVGLKFVTEAERRGH